VVLLLTLIGFIIFSIVMKDGKEVGRVVEYGKTGKWDVELAELLK